MGLGIGSLSRYDTKEYSTPDRPVFPNPDPTRFKINKTVTIGRYLLVDITYLDCTNYEGRKLLLYVDTALTDLERQGSIDPHFSENRAFHSPIARFEPSDAGLYMARLLMIELDEICRNS